MALDREDASMAQKKTLPILLTDDIAMDSGRERRSAAVKQCASGLARRLKTSIDLIHVEDLMLYPVRTPQYQPLIKKYFSEQKAKLAKFARSLGVPTRAHFLNGEPSQKILSLSAKKNAYEIVVLGTHGRTGLSRLVLGSVAEQVIRQARIPVMTVGPKAQKSGVEFFSQPQMTFVVPTDLSPNCDRAEAYAISLAKRLGAKVLFFYSMHEVLHPVFQSGFAMPVSPAPTTEFFDELKEDCIKKLSLKIKKAQNHGVKADFLLDHRTLSSATAVLKASAKVEASLIVMGTHGRSLLAGAFFGRTARDVILGATIPVVTLQSVKS